MDIIAQLCGSSAIAAILYVSLRFMQEPFNKILQGAVAGAGVVGLCWLVAVAVADVLTRFGVL